VKLAAAHTRLEAVVTQVRTAPLRLLARLACVLLLATVVGGCTKLMYNRLDSLAAWYVGSLVSLDQQQRADLRSWLSQTLQWHRESELSRYAQFLRELASQASQPATPEVYRGVTRRIEGFGNDFMTQTAPQAARLLLQLSPEQVDEFITNLEEKSRERAEESLDEISSGTWHEQRVKDGQRQLKRWTGAATAEQKEILRATTAGIQPTSNEWLESQRQWRTSLRAALQDRDEARILQLLREPEREWTEQYSAKSERNREQTLVLLQSLDASLTPAQRERVQRELIKLAEQLEALTEE
jgi:Family of unknown function (DUF6279)